MSTDCDVTGSYSHYSPPDGNTRWTTTQYDAVGRPTSVQPPDPNIPATTTLYALEQDQSGAQRQAVKTTDARGHLVWRLSDAFGRLAEVKEFDENNVLYSTTDYTYTPLDLLTTVTDGYGHITQMDYDFAGRKADMTDPTMGTWQYTYDPNGNLHTQTDAKGQMITFSYDNLDRLTGETAPDPADSTVYTYDDPAATFGWAWRTGMTRAQAGAPLARSGITMRAGRR